MATPPSEQRRLRELRKYYTRSSDDTSVRSTDDDATDSVLSPSTTPISSPNKILTALMQLIACRLGMQRAMVSVVDQNEQVNTFHLRISWAFSWLIELVFSGRVNKDLEFGRFITRRDRRRTLDGMRRVRLPSSVLIISDADSSIIQNKTYRSTLCCK
jgi:hypothetical protein